MKQIQNILFIFIIVSLLPTSVIAQVYISFEDEINGIDIRISDLMNQRNNNRIEQEEINHLVSEVSQWFTSYDNVNNEIKRVQQEINQYGSFQNSKSENQLRDLKQEQSDIFNLRGGSTIGESTYSSIDDLKNLMSEYSERIVTLLNEDEKLTMDLRELDIQRDRLYAKLEGENHELWQKGLEQKIDRLLEDYNRDLTLVDNPKAWCVRTNDNTPMKCLPGKLFITLLTDRYINKLSQTPGMKFDQNELANLIKKYKKESNEIKRKMKSMGINEELLQISEIRRKLEKGLEKADPSGCWIIAIGTGKRPQINIVKNSEGEYDGIITDPGPLDYKRGKRLFTVARINSTTFVGTEYSHSNTGIETRISLRIIVKKDRSSADYRTSDDQLMLLPCW